VWAQEVFYCSRAITNTVQRSHQPKCAAVCVLVTAKEMHSVLMHQMWCGLVWGALLRGISQQNKFVKHYLFEWCVLW